MIIREEYIELLENLDKHCEKCDLCPCDKGDLCNIACVNGESPAATLEFLNRIDEIQEDLVNGVYTIKSKRR